MNEFDKRIINGLEEMEKRMGRMLRNMSIPGMGPLCSGTWTPAVDIYETKTDIVVYLDMAGVDPDNLVVSAERTGVTISGRRDSPSRDDINCIHQLEIECGCFERQVSFPVPVDVERTSSSCKNGMLQIIMPKETPTKGKINIDIE